MKIISSNPIDELIKQIKTSLKNGDYYIAIFMCLTLPDICAALESKDGEASGKKFKDWFDKYVSDKYYGMLSGDTCYRLRCGTLHQGKAMHAKLGYERIIFTPTINGNVFHCNVLNDALNLDINTFSHDIIDGVATWMNDMKNNEFFVENFKSFLKIYPNGLPPYIVGYPVIS
ncbi:Uncharacterised protein [Providencia rustigianii]|uniref:Uncharacterized protein n=1 Tax=Providencia rustigianii TaxID=158850 RepID=A0A379G5A2_9GAMM|nr:hypothetical protein [Providencia rustigianii]SUC35803.1 Uncharacterised protein [Providencia rustigianii]